jgi:putative sterol carrier protein
MTDVKQIFSEMPRRFDPDAARGLNAVIQFSLSGDKGGSYHAIIENGTIDVREGVHRSPHMTLSMKGEDYIALATGTLSTQMAFMTGRLRIAGDMELAVKMQSFLRVA